MKNILVGQSEMHIANVLTGQPVVVSAVVEIQAERRDEPSVGKPGRQECGN